jgi:hypothetical protein
MPDGNMARHCDNTITGFVGYKKRLELVEEGKSCEVKGSSPEALEAAKRQLKRVGRTSLGNYGGESAKQSYSPLRAISPKVPQTTYRGHTNNVYLPRQDKYDGYF